MALPTLERTWQYNVNQQTPTSGTLATDRSALLYKIKAALTGFASSPWTVVKSSNGVTAGAADYWASPANLTGAASGNAHSWIVLQQSGITGGPLQLCLDLGSSDQAYIYTLMSYAGFNTGGTITNRPTATDEQAIWNPAQWFASAGDTVLHVLQSTDGRSTRVVSMIASTIRNLWMVEDVADSPLTYRGVCSFAGQVSTISNYLGTALFWGRFGAIPLTAFVGTEVYKNVAAAEANSGAVSDITNAYPITPLSLHSETPSAKGRLGRLVDLWFGSPALVLGSTYPATPADREFIHMKPFVMPWNGSAPILA